MIRPLVLAALLPLCACAGRWPSEPYVHTDAPEDAATLAPAIADFVARGAPAESPVSVPVSVMAQAIEEDLIRDGLRVTPTGRPVGYVVTPFDASTLLRVTFAGGVGSRLFSRNAEGKLVPVGPMMEIRP